MFGLNAEMLKSVPMYQRVIVLSVFLLIIILGFMYLVYLPKNSEIEGLQIQVSQVRDEINVNQIKLRKLDQLKKENEALEKELEERKRQLPSEEEVATLLKQVSDLGVGTGLDFKLWKPKASQKSPTGLYVAIPVDVEVAGGYHSVGMFFDRINNLPRIVNISNLKMTNAKEEKDGRVKIQTNFIATAFAAIKEPPTTPK
ncbi:MAG TPA: type 4a pilus biogenesis protein PilO [Nitrospiria bacterium]